MLLVELHRAQSFQLTGFETLRHIGVGHQLVEEIGVITTGVFYRPRFHRRALHQRIGRLSREALADEGEQDSLAVPHPKTEAQIFLHVFRINIQAVHHALK